MSLSSAWNRSKNPGSVLAAVLFLPALGTTCLFACSATGGDGTTGAATTASAAAPAPAKSNSAGTTRGDDDIKPLYPVDGSPPEPLALRFCQAVIDIEARRRGECCGAPGETGRFTGECARTLSAAIRLNAASLDAGDVDKCEAAVGKDLEGCGWVGPSTPDLPAACEGVIHGLLTDEAVCRSSLECAEGLTCHGLTATRTGKCFPPKPAGVVCGGGIDTLAAFTRQNRTSETHRECAGYCSRPVCSDPVALGGACKSSEECGPKRTCLNDKCSADPLPAVGQSCARGLCARGARCVKDKCVAPRGEGEECSTDLECRGVCDRPEGAAAGKCGKRCIVMKIPTSPVFSSKFPPRSPPKR